MTPLSLEFDARLTRETGLSSWLPTALLPGPALETRLWGELDSRGCVRPAPGRRPPQPRRPTRRLNERGCQGSLYSRGPPSLTLSNITRIRLSPSTATPSALAPFSAPVRRPIGSSFALVEAPAANRL